MRTRPSIQHILASALLATVLVTGVSNAAVRTSAKVALHATLASTPKAHWGLAVSNTAVNPGALENAMGRVFASRGVYAQLGGQKYPNDGALAARRESSQIYLNINSWHVVSGKKVCYPFADVAAGTYNNLLANWVRELTAFGYNRTIVVYNHEPTADSPSQPHCGSASDYVNAYKHVVSYFRNHGIDYPFVWNEVASAYNQGIAKNYQPPASYFQIVGVDGYNRYLHGDWRTPSYIFTAAHRYAVSLHKPLLIAEIGTVEDPHNSSRKADWLTAASNLFRSWDRIVAVEWNDAREFRPDSSVKSLAAWVLCSTWPFSLP
jgi:hypothetical protein